MQQAIKMWMVQTDKYYDFIARSGKKIGFDIDARWSGLNHQIAIKVTYFDKKAGTLNLVYNDGVKQQQKSQTLLGDNKLKTATFIVPKMVLNTLPNNFDFALEAGTNTENIVVSLVRVVQANESTVSSNNAILERESVINITYPSGGKTMAITGQNSLKQIDVYNIAGKRVKSININENRYELQITGFSPGIYLVLVQDKNGNVQREKVCLWQ
jgi:hypothetical protein